MSNSHPHRTFAPTPANTMSGGGLSFSDSSSGEDDDLFTGPFGASSATPARPRHTSTQFSSDVSTRPMRLDSRMTTVSAGSSDGAGLCFSSSDSEEKQEIPSTFASTAISVQPSVGIDDDHRGDVAMQSNDEEDDVEEEELGKNVSKIAVESNDGVDLNHPTEEKICPDWVSTLGKALARALYDRRANQTRQNASKLWQIAQRNSTTSIQRRNDDGVHDDDDEEDGHGELKPFQFDTPSPDDCVFAKRKMAFKQQKSKERSQFERGKSPSSMSTPKSTGGKRAVIVVGSSSSGSSVGSDKGMKKKDENAPPPSDGGKKLGTSGGEHQGKKKGKIPFQRPAGKTRSLNGAVAKHMETSDPATRGVNMVVIGHVDAGKSTLMGHLLFLLGRVTKKAMHKHERESEIAGKGSFSFAWVMDAHEEERLRGVTMDVAVQHFTCPNGRPVTVLDAPGHRDFVPNMITGAAQADVGVLVVNATKGEFERGFKSDGQTKEHTLLARSLGVEQLIVAVNKMDTVGWAQSRFDYIKMELEVFLRQAGYSKRNVRFVPISGMKGDNIVELNVKRLQEWYTGPTLVQSIEQFEPVARDHDKPFRMTISDVYQDERLGLAVGGKVEAGVLAGRDKLLVMPIGEICTVKNISRHGERVDWASAGDNVDVGLLDIDPHSLMVGSVLCDPQHPISVCDRVRGRIVVFNVTYPITKGYGVVLHTQSINESAHISKLVSLLDRSGDVKKRRPRCISDKSTAVVEIRFDRPVCLELFSKYRALGRFTLRDRGRTIACGVVEKLWNCKGDESATSS